MPSVTEPYSPPTHSSAIPIAAIPGRRKVACSTPFLPRWLCVCGAEAVFLLLFSCHPFPLSETEKGILTWLFWCESLEMTAFKGNIVFENYQALCETDSHTHCGSDVIVLHLANPSTSQPPASPALTYCPRGILVPPFSSPSWAPVPEREMWGGPAKIRRAGLQCLLGRSFDNGLFKPTAEWLVFSAVSKCPCIKIAVLEQLLQCSGNKGGHASVIWTLHKKPPGM